MGKEDDEFQLDQTYNLVFGQIFLLVKNGDYKKQYGIWIQEDNDTQYTLRAVPAGSSLFDEDHTYVQWVVNWTPHLDDAGRIMRKVVRAISEYRRMRKTELDKQKDLVPPDDSKSDSEQQPPGIV